MNTHPTTAITAADSRRAAQDILRRVLGHVIDHNGGYLSQACSSAEILATLYLRVLRLGPSEGPAEPPPFSGVPAPGRPVAGIGERYNGAHAPDLDRFIFSPVHYALGLYATLIEMGRLGETGLQHFNQDGSTVEMIGAEHSPGIAVTAGSLAQALSQAGGIALGRRLKGERGRVIVMMSDGELQEGQTWEAFAALAFHRLDNVVVYIDVNGQQCDGVMTSVGEIGDPAARLEAFGATVVVVDGHDIEALTAAAATPHAGKPLVVLCATDPCHGVDLLRERQTIGKIHHVRFVDEAERERYAAYHARWTRDADTDADADTNANANANADTDTEEVRR
ncbi:MAG: transketolase [Deltaproteobacteria bacterium]|nr:transketolase [Deltaproteobacteria bacterium]